VLLFGLNQAFILLTPFIKGDFIMTEKKNNWTIMAVIAILVGLFIVFVAPGLFDTTMDQLIIDLEAVETGNKSVGWSLKPYVYRLALQRN
jgi:uncharacterized membrane protein